MKLLELAPSLHVGVICGDGMAISGADLELLARYQETHDPAAFGEIVRRYAAAVYTACHRILRDPARAEDAAQETFYRLMTRPHRVHTSLGGWLHRAATRLALDIQRSDSARRRREAAYESTGAHEHGPAEELDATSWADVAPQLDEAISALPDEHREILVRHFLRGESQADLATELHTSPATLSRRMKHAVDLLRDELGRRGVTVAPLVLFNLMALNGPSATSVTLKTALGKLLLYSAARSGIRPFSWKKAIYSLPQSVYSLRWAIAAAAFSLFIFAMLGLGIRQLQWGPEPQNPTTSVRDVRTVADSHLIHVP